MAQFDVHRNAVRASWRRIPFLVDVQSNLLADLRTRVVIPVLDPAMDAVRPIAHLNPIVVIEGRRLLLLVQEIAGIPIGALGAKVASLADRRNDLLRAMDVLWIGT